MALKEKAEAEVPAVAEEAGAVAVAVDVNAMPFAKFHGIMEVDYDTFTRIRSGGGTMVSDDGDPGRWLEMQVISWHHRWTLSPGEDGDEAKAALRYSADGETIDDTGESVNEVLEQMKDRFPRAAKKKYTFLVGKLLKSENPINSQMIQVQLSKTSSATFTAHCMSKLMEGPDFVDNGVVRVEARPAKNSKYSFTKLVVCDPQ